MYCKVVYRIKFAGQMFFEKDDVWISDYMEYEGWDIYEKMIHVA